MQMKKSVLIFTVAISMVACNKERPYSCVCDANFNDLVIEIESEPEYVTRSEREIYEFQCSSQNYTYHEEMRRFVEVDNCELKKLD